MPSTRSLAVAVPFVLATALAIILTGPLLLFDPLVVSVEQGRHNVPESLSTTGDEVARITNSMLGDLFFDGSFEVSLNGTEPFLDSSERSHMRDVGRLVRTLVTLEIASLVVAILLGWWLRRERDLRGRLLLAAAATVGVAAVLLGVFFAVAFDAAFAAFHGLFFEPGSWQFAPGSHLITLFPEPFWFELALLAGLTIVIGAVLVALLGRRDLTTAPVGG
jgi:integral membrane protein (TIGR01906 family)